MTQMTTILTVLTLCGMAYAEPVTVAVRDEASVTAKIVQIGDVADLTGGSASIRKNIAELDLAELDAGSKETISNRRILVRLLLSDVREADYQITGARAVSVQSVEARNLASGDQLITTPIQLAYGERLQLPVERITVELTRPLGDIGVDLRRVTVRPIMPATPRFGDVQLRIGLHLDNRLIKTISVSASIQRLRPVVTAAAEIQRGQVILASHLQVIDLPVTSTAPVASPDQLIGKTARRAIGHGQKLNLHDVSTTAQKKQAPYVIKPRAAVRIVARRGGLTVFANAGEALSSARIGDVIRVRNSRSGRIITAKVISSTEVQVSF